MEVGEVWCTDRTGHETRSQLDRYRQMARTIKELDLGELMPLDLAVPELDKEELIAPSLPHGSPRPLGEMANAGDLKSPVSQETSRFESGRGYRLRVSTTGPDSRWNAHKKLRDRTWYAQRSEKIGDKVVIFKMHRQILGITNPRVEVDHLDHNGLNNQRQNLRPGSHSQNMQNQSKRLGCSSELQGVSFYKRTGKWRAYAGDRHLGYFNTEREAHERVQQEQE